METGTVKFFNEEKGYGFISQDGSSKDIFVHKSATSEFIRENDRVEFDVEQGDRGPVAKKCQDHLVRPTTYSGQQITILIKEV